MCQLHGYFTRIASETAATVSCSFADRSGGEPWSSKLRGEIPGQQFVDPVDRVVGDELEDASQVGLGVEAAELGGSSEGVDAGRLATRYVQPCPNTFPG
jgi:hypothetical protein